VSGRRADEDKEIVCKRKRWQLRAIPPDRQRERDRARHPDSVTSDLRVGASGGPAETTTVWAVPDVSPRQTARWPARPPVQLGSTATPAIASTSISRSDIPDVSGCSTMPACAEFGTKRYPVVK